MDIYNYLITTLNNILTYDRRPNPSVIFDIDGTLISLDGAPINSVINFHKYCIENNIKTFIVTARLGFPENIQATKEQLFQYGIKDFKSMYFLSPKSTNVPISKLNSRKNIKERGFNTLMSLGDNKWDIGEFGGLGIIIH